MKVTSLSILSLSCPSATCLTRVLPAEEPVVQGCDYIGEIPAVNVCKCMNVKRSGAQKTGCMLNKSIS